MKTTEQLSMLNVLLYRGPPLLLQVVFMDKAGDGNGDVEEESRVQRPRLRKKGPHWIFGSAYRR